MPRRTLTILSLIGLLLSVGLWGVSYWNVSALFIRRAEGATIDLMQGYLQFNYVAYVGGPRQPTAPPGGERSTRRGSLRGNLRRGFPFTKPHSATPCQKQQNVSLPLKHHKR